MQQKKPRPEGKKIKLSPTGRELAAANKRLRESPPVLSRFASSHLKE